MRVVLHRMPYVRSEYFLCSGYSSRLCSNILGQRRRFTYMPLLTRSDSRASTDSFESTIQALFAQSDGEGNVHIDETASASLVPATSKAGVAASHGPVSAWVCTLELACLSLGNRSIFGCHGTSIAFSHCTLTIVRLQNPTVSSPGSENPAFTSKDVRRVRAMLAFNSTLPYRSLRSPFHAGLA